MTVGRLQISMYSTCMQYKCKQRKANALSFWITWKPEKLLLPGTLQQVFEQEKFAHSFLLVDMFSGMFQAPVQF